MNTTQKIVSYSALLKKIRKGNPSGEAYEKIRRQYNIQFCMKVKLGRGTAFFVTQEEFDRVVALHQETIQKEQNQKEQQPAFVTQKEKVSLQVQLESLQLTMEEISREQGLTVKALGIHVDHLDKISTLLATVAKELGITIPQPNPLHSPPSHPKPVPPSGGP